MDYIRQLDAFLEKSSLVLNSNEVNVYLRLFAKSYDEGWKEWTPVTNEWLQLATCIGSNHTVIAARNTLKEKGFIDFRPGERRKHPTMYKIIPLTE